MIGYYTLINTLKNHFASDPLVSVVTQGDIFEVDLGKQMIFPLTHIMVTQAQFEPRIQRFNLTIMAMDVVDITKLETTDAFETKDNTIDVLNTQLAVLNRAYQMLQHGALYDLNYSVEGTPSCEPFTERFENYLAGWVMTVTVICPNEMTIC